MTAKKQNSIISLSDYRKKKLTKQKTKESVLEKKEQSFKNETQSMGKIFYMSNYLKTKKIPELKELKKEENKSFVPSSKESAPANNIIILDEYRKRKNTERIWKKEFPKEALSVAGMAFLFLFTFNLAISIQSNSPSKAFSPAGGLIARGENTPYSQEKLEEGSKSNNSFRQIASSKEKKPVSLSHKKWVQKIKQLDRKKVILGKKSSSSDYTGF